MNQQTKLQQLRLQNNLSQSDLARISGVNFRTLQDFDQGRKSLANAKGEMIYRLCLALNCSITELLSTDIIIEENENARKIQLQNRLMTYAQSMSPGKTSYYGEYYSFPVLVHRKGVKMEYIYPAKQATIAKIHDALTPHDEVASVMLFGSSISMRCTYNSDTDLAIRLVDTSNTRETRDMISETVQEICDWNADIIWFDRITKEDRIYHDICKGVQIV